MTSLSKEKQLCSKTDFEMYISNIEKDKNKTGEQSMDEDSVADIVFKEPSFEEYDVYGWGNDDDNGVEESKNNPPEYLSLKGTSGFLKSLDISSLLFYPTQQYTDST